MSEREETRWRQVDAVFAAALARPEAEREAFVARECGGDTRLAESVRRLLDAAAECDAFWRRAARQRSVALRETLEVGGWRADPPDRSEGAGPPAGERP